MHIEGSETEDLRVASGGDSFMLELSSDCQIRYVSLSFEKIIGRTCASVIGLPVSEIIAGRSKDKQVFCDALEEMKAADRSVRVIFSISTVGPRRLAQKRAHGDVAEAGLDIDTIAGKNEEAATKSQPIGVRESVEVEGQGTLLRPTGRSESSLWVLRPYKQRGLQALGLPEELKIAVGFGADVLASFLEDLAEAVRTQSSAVPVPPQELCRICDRLIQTWYFERHSELCLIESRLEHRISSAHEALVEHRNLLLVLVSRDERPTTYKGIQLPSLQHMRPRSLSSKFAVRISSPLATPRAREDPVSTFIQSLIAITDTALEIDLPEEAPAFSSDNNDTASEAASDDDARFDTSTLADGDATVIISHSTARGSPEKGDPGSDTETVDDNFSPNDTATEGDLSERALDLVSRVESWDPPHVDQPALVALGVDTKTLVDEKAKSVFRMKQFNLLSDKLQHEVEAMVRDAIEHTAAVASTPAPADNKNPSVNDDKDANQDVLDARKQERANSSALVLHRSSESSVSLRPPVALKLDTRHSELQEGACVTEPEDCGDGGEIIRPLCGRSRRESSKSLLHFTAGPIPKVSSPMRRRSSSAQQNHNGGSPCGSPWLSPMASPRLTPWPAVPHLPSRGSFSSLSSPRAQLSSSFASPTTPSTSIFNTQNRTEERLASGQSTQTASSDEERKFSMSSKSCKNAPPSIRDFEIIRPISRGAYGVVYLSRKKLTGDYFAIKVLKKSDMVEKNQVGNVRAERAIMISTADSEYVAKLYFTFQSRDYLYLVMEYLSGGDCASVIQALGCLTEDWARQYAAETIIAVNSLHVQGIIHRDLKPDNILISSDGHIKLSDFGLSVKGLVTKNSQFEMESSGKEDSPSTPIGQLSRSASPSAENCSRASYCQDPLDFRSGLSTTKKPNRFVGTPDYLAPETIDGGIQGDVTDWWSLGCILYEFLYGCPPFNATNAQEIFMRIKSRDFSFPELDKEHDVSSSAKDLIGRLLTVNPAERLGANGVSEIMRHPFFSGVNWDTLFTADPSFIPNIDNPEDTSYFDARGATLQEFDDDEINLASSFRDETGRKIGSASFGSGRIPRVVSSASLSSSATSGESFLQSAATTPQKARRLDRPGVLDSPGVPLSRRASRLCSSPADEFGSFAFKNLPVLERANNDVITKLRTGSNERRMSVSSFLSSGSWADSPLSFSVTDNSPFSSDTEDTKNAALRRVNRQRQEMRKSFSMSKEGPSNALAHYTVDVLMGIGNPVCRSTAEKLLSQLGVRVLSCTSAEELIRRSTSSVKFDLILLDDQLDDGLSNHDVCQVIRATVNSNASTPIVKLTPASNEVSSAYAGALETPVTKAGLMSMLKHHCNWKPGETTVFDR